MRKNECFFCTDCDAVKCPERLLQHLRRIAEQAGKEQYFNAVHLCGELVQDCMRELRVVLNRPRPGASACSPASPAPSAHPDPKPGTGGSLSSKVPLPSSSAPVAAVVADPSAAIRANPAKQYGRCPICGEWGANRERRINGNDQCPKGHSYPSPTAVYHVPPPQPEKPKPAAASAWDEFRDAYPLGYTPREFSEWLAAREKAAVERAIHEKYENIKNWAGCDFAPKPRRAPEVVAREVWDTMPAGCVNDYIEFAAAAVRADRKEHE